MTLPRNSLVEPIETEAGWLSVRTFEWSSGEIIEGWVYGTEPVNDNGTLYGIN